MAPQALHDLIETLAKLTQHAESYVNLTRTRGYDLRPESADQIRNVIAEAKQQLAALLAPRPVEQEEQEDHSRVDQSALFTGQDLPRKPQPGSSQRVCPACGWTGSVVDMSGGASHCAVCKVVF